MSLDVRHRARSKRPMRLTQAIVTAIACAASFSVSAQGVVSAQPAGSTPVTAAEQASGSNPASDSPSARTSRLAPLASPAGDQVSPSWRFVGLPEQRFPPTVYSIVRNQGRAALRIESDGSYGNLVHSLAAPSELAGRLRWSWQLEQPLERADLRTKETDDAAVKVCAFFDPPPDSIPFFERALLGLARAASGQDLPGATVCYAWSRSVAAGTVLPNAYTSRMRWIVLRSDEAPRGQWLSESRDLAADYRAAFGGEVPPLTGIAVGADADNTGGRALAFVADLVLTP